MRWWPLGAAVLAVWLSPCAMGQSAVTVATWNIEHLGSPGRGFNGIGSGSLPPRTRAELASMARTIKQVLKADLLALQEVAITGRRDDRSINRQLDVLVAELGPSWRYALPSVQRLPDADSFHNLHNAYLWDSKRVRMLSVFPLPVPRVKVGDTSAFDRVPLVGYFEALRAGRPTNDFLMINVHLKSGQDNDENHLAAMVMLEQALDRALANHRVRESDRVVLGDFNDNPWSRDANGRLRYMDLMYQYMERKGYTNLVSEASGYTRMNHGRSSIIDHVLVNRSVRRHLLDERAKVGRPADTSNDGLARWRRSHSDHFPVTFRLRVETQDDDVDF